MKYESKLKIPLELERNALKRLEEELQQSIEIKEKIQKEIQKEEDKIYDFHSHLTGHEVVSSSFFTASFDRIYVLRKTGELNEIREFIIQKMFEIKSQKNRIDKLLEVDFKRKKEFDKLTQKKEQRKYEELKNITKIRDERGETY